MEFPVLQGGRASRRGRVDGHVIRVVAPVLPVTHRETTRADEQRMWERWIAMRARILLLASDAAVDPPPLSFRFATLDSVMREVFDGALARVVEGQEVWSLAAMEIEAVDRLRALWLPRMRSASAASQPPLMPDEMVPVVHSGGRSMPPLQLR